MGEEERVDELKLVKVNIDEERELAEKYGIASIPTMILFKDGEPSAAVVGVLAIDGFSTSLLAQILGMRSVHHVLRPLHAFAVEGDRLARIHAELAVLPIAELPAAKAGPILCATVLSGELNGVIATTTPSGTRSVKPMRPDC